MTTRAVLYVRLSRASDLSTSLAGQAADLRAHAEREGWDVVEVLADDGMSARKVRANADRALDLLRSHAVDVLAVASVDRWTRIGVEDVGKLVGVLRESGGRFLALREGLDSAAGDDSFAMRLSIHAEIAKREGDLIASRVKSSRSRLLADGRFRGGRVPFGYMPAPNPKGPGRILVPDPVEVPVAREVADRILAGETLTSIVRYLRAERVPTALSEARRKRQAGEPWEAHERGTWALMQVRNVWTGWTLAGRSTVATGAKSRDLLRGADGLPLQLWEPVLDVATATRLNALFTQRRKPPVRAARLLSGLAFCKCGAKMYVGTYGRQPFYRCGARSLEQDADCGTVRIAAVALEEHVASEYLAIVGRFPELVEETVVDNPATADELAATESEIEDVTAALRRPGADRAPLYKRLDELIDRRDVLAAVPATTRTFWRSTGRTWANAWHADENLAARRARLGLAIDHVEVQSVTVPNTPDRRAVIRWRDFPEA